MSRSKVTIFDVAQAAGVSPKTVSRVINGEPHVRPQLLEKVQKAIERLGFVPNAAARSLAGVRSFIIAALFDNPSPYYIAELQDGAMRRCRAAGYHLVIEKLALGDPRSLLETERMLRVARLDGVILSPPVTDHPAILRCLQQRNIPFVQLSPFAVSGQASAIYSNDADGARAVARHLWQLGHRRIGFVAGPETHVAASLRREGFMAELVECGIDPDAVEIEPGDFSFATGMEAGLRLLRREPRVSAIFATNDDMAAGVVAAAAQLGIRIPDELSVVGFDDSPVATYVWPPLTTVRQPIAEMSAEATRMLIDARGEMPTEIKRFDVELVTRQSTGPCAPTD